MGPISNVVVFCGAHGHSVYEPLAYSVGAALAKQGFAVVTGGGPGIMEAVNKGAYDAGGTSIGVCIQHPTEKPHQYLTSHKIYTSFDIRHKALIEMGDAFVVLPGGLGTLLEAVEITQKKKFGEITAGTPLVFMGAYYEKTIELFEYMKQEGFIGEDVSRVYTLVQTPDELVRVLTKS